MSSTPSSVKWTQATEALQQGMTDDALRLAQQELLNSTSSQDRSRWELVLGVAHALQGDSSAVTCFQRALQLNPENLIAKLNLDLLHADGVQATEVSSKSSSSRVTRVAVLSFLFNWPSTGGGIVHTVELCDFLQRAGYEVQHIYAHFEPWEIGIVKQSTPMPSQALSFTPSQWNLENILNAYRNALRKFQPDYVIITDSWNMKPVLAQAVDDVPYLLRLQALECLCPLNNIRLLPDGNGGVRQCSLHQLATPQDCSRCLQQRGQRSGSLHQDERALAGVGTENYDRQLRQAFWNAHAVLVVNPLTEAMVAPYAQRVLTVTAGMDPARFPDPWPNDPAPTTSRARKQILYAGLMNETIKGFSVLHDACQLLWNERQDFDLLVTADPVGVFAPWGRTIGWQTQANLPSVMRSVDIVAVPAIAQEALGRTAVEAMGASRPVVASRLGGLPFTIPDGATGLLFEPGNAPDLAAKLKRLLDDHQHAEHLGHAGRKRFLEHYAWPVIIEKHYIPLLGSPVRSS